MLRGPRQCLGPEPLLAERGCQRLLLLLSRFLGAVGSGGASSASPSGSPSLAMFLPLPAATQLPVYRFGQKKHLPVAWQPSAARSSGGCRRALCGGGGLSPARSPHRAGASVGARGCGGCWVPEVGTAKPPQHFPCLGLAPQGLVASRLCPGCGTGAMGSPLGSTTRRLRAPWFPQDAIHPANKQPHLTVRRHRKTSRARKTWLPPAFSVPGVITTGLGGRDSPVPPGCARGAELVPWARRWGAQPSAFKHRGFPQDVFHRANRQAHLTVRRHRKTSGVRKTWLPPGARPPWPLLPSGGATAL